MPESHAEASPIALVDRDGVLVEERPERVLGPADLRPLPGALIAIARLCAAGWRVAVVTNQSVVGRGILSESELDVIHAHLRALVREAGGCLEGIWVCPHAPDAGCDCRKPQPRLIRDAIAAMSGDPETTVFIGDQPSDLEAARAAGVAAILVLSGKTRAYTEAATPSPMAVLKDLTEAADFLLGRPMPLSRCENRE